jgi:hypothetical protein
VAENRSRSGPFSQWWLYDSVLCWKVDKLLNLRLDEETKGLQVEYHWMRSVRVDKKIFGAPRW